LRLYHVLCFNSSESEMLKHITTYETIMKIRILLFLTLALGSCISTKKLLRPHENTSTRSFEKNINGVYENIDISATMGNSSLLNVLYEKMNTKYPDDWQDLRVHVSCEDRKIYFRGFAGDSLVYENEIWGHIHENRFTSNRKFMLLPFLLFNMQKESRILMFIDEEGNLHATHRGYYWWFVAFGANSSTGDSRIYERFGQFRKVGDLPSPFS